MSVSKYDRPDRPSPYGVKWTVDGKRNFKFFKKRVLRDDFFKSLTKKEKEIGNALLNLTATEAAIMRRCVELLSTPEKVMLACQEYAGKVQLIPCPAPNAIKEYLEEKEKLDRDANYYRAIKNILNRLNHRFPANFAEWSSDTAQQWAFELTESYAPVTVHNHVKVSRAFCHWAVERKYMHENIFSKVQIPDVIMPEPEFLKVKDMEKLFDTACEKFPKAVAYLALGAFAGIRSSACARLESDAINIKQQGILIQARQAKNKRRIYVDGHESNLWLWLEWARKHAPEGFSLTKRQWDAVRSRVAEAANVKMPHNALRHSFCTYHVAWYGDAGKTATLLTQRGNVSILYEHYKGNTSRTEAEKYFSIVPKK